MPAYKTTLDMQYGPSSYFVARTKFLVGLMKKRQDLAVIRPDIQISQNFIFNHF